MADPLLFLRCPSAARGGFIGDIIGNCRQRLLNGRRAPGVQLRQRRDGHRQVDKITAFAHIETSRPVCVFLGVCQESVGSLIGAVV
jgi:hypothetical protein